MYDFTKTSDRHIDNAQELVNDALFEEGFDILTEINLTATKRNKIGMDSQTNFVFVAYNPSSALSILLANKTIRIVSPGSLVNQTNQIRSLSMATGNSDTKYDIQREALDSINGEIREKLDRVVDSLCNPPEN